MDLGELDIIATMASLSLDDEEMQLLARGVEEMISYFSKMAELEVDDFLPMTHPNYQDRELRIDCPVASDVGSFLNLAPRREDGYFLVPKVV